MSKQIDERVVEMRFDNKQFENNVQTTMSTLDKLKEKLKLKGASDGLDNVNKSAKKTDMSPLSRSIETVQAKFSALQVAGVTALANITNSAVNYGKRIVSALTIDPIKTGFQEYETQINSVQTILANTESKGSTLQDVNNALAELNTYADKTIYNFTEMTRNIGTFTAAGVDLKTSVSAIKGIANLAAVSGSNSQQASTAMYQLSQALASGTVKLMDWNSVVNAGMGGQVFQDSLKETARVHGVAIDKMIEDEGSFRETLKNEWLTSEILTETLAKFTGDLSKEQLKSLGYTDEQIKGIIKMGKTANDAATKVKTFTQLFDTLKEAAQSGWTKSWELLIGDFGEAKDLLTDISNLLGGVIGDSADKRNAMLMGGLSTGWKQLLNEGIHDAAGFEETVSNVAKEHGVDIASMITDEKSFQDVLKESLSSGKLTSETLSESISKFTEKVTGMSAAELEAAGYTEEQIKKLQELDKKVKDGSISMEKFTELITRPSGRELLIESLWNSIKAIKSIIAPISQAFGEVFKPFTGDDLYKVIESIRDFTSKLTLSGEQSEKLKSTFKGLFSVIKVGVDIVKSIVSGCGKLLGTILPIGNGLLDVTGSFGDFLTGMAEAIDVSKIFGDVFDGAAGILGAVATGIGSVLSSLASGIDKCGGIIGIVGKIVDVIELLFDKITVAMPGNSIFDTLFDLVNGGIFTVIAVWIAKFVKTIKNFSDNAGGFLESITGILEGVGDALDAFTGSIKANTLKSIAISIGILAASLLVLSLIDPAKLTVALTAMTVALGELMGVMTIMDKLFSGNKLESLVKLKLVASTMTSVAISLLILAAAMKILSSMSWQEMGVAIVSLTAGLGALIGAIYLLPQKDVDAVAKSITKLTWALLILAVAIKLMSSMSWQEMGVGLISMTVGLGALVGAVHLLPKDVSVKAGSLVALASALVVLSIALKIMGSMSWQEMTVGLGGMVIALAALIGALHILPKDVAGKAGSLIVLASALVVLGAALKIMSSMSWQELAIGIGGMAVSLAVLVGALHLLPKDVAGKAASILVLSAAMVVLGAALKILGSMSVGELAKGIGAIAATLLVLGVAAYALAPVSGVCLAIGGAIALLGVGCLAAGAGLILISAGITALATAIVGSAGIILAGANEIVGVFTTIILSLVTAIVTCIPAITNGMLQLLVSVLTGLVQYAPQLADLLVQLLICCIDTLAARASEFVASASNFIVIIINSLAEHVPEFVAAGINLVGAIIQGISQALGPIIQNIIVPILGIFKDIIVSLAEAIAPYIPTICDAFVTITQTISNAIVRIMEILAPFIPYIQAMVESLAPVLLKICDAFIVLVTQIAPIINSITNLVRQLGDSITQILMGIAVVIATCGNAIAEVFRSIGDVISEVGETIRNSLDGLAGVFDSVFGGISDVIESVGKSIKDVLEGISDVIESIGKAALDAGTGFENLANGVKKITDLKLADMVASLAAVAKGVKDIGDNSDGLAIAGEGMKQLVNGAQLSASSFTSIINNLSNIGPLANNAMSSLISAVVSASASITNSAGAFLIAGKSIVTNLSAGMVESITIVQNGISTLMKTTVQSAKAYYLSFWTLGLYLVLGFAIGIRNNKHIAGSAGTELGNYAYQKAKEAIDSNSPSKKFMKLGLYSVQGLAKGITDNLGYAKKSAVGLGKAILTATQDYLGIHSPSIVFDKKVGRYIAQGIAEGIEADMSAEEAAKKKAQNILDAFQKAFDTLDIDKSLAQANYDKWLSENPNATETQKQAKEIEWIETQKKNIESVQQYRWDLYQQMLNDPTFGANHDETKKALTEWINGQTEWNNLSNQINDILKESADEAKTLDKERNDILYEGWVAAHPEATDAQKYKAERDFILDEIKERNDEWKEAIKEYYRLLELHGPDSVEVKRAEAAMITAWRDYYSEKSKLDDLDKNYLEERKAKDQDKLKTASDIAKLEYDIWEELHPKATDDEKDSRRLQYLTQQLGYETQLLTQAYDEWQKALGTEEEQEKYYAYLQKKYDTAQLEGDILDVQESIADRQKRVADKQKLARKGYDDYIKKYKKYYEENGMSLEDLERDAKLVSGYDPTKTVSTVVQNTNTALSKVSSSPAYANTISGFNTMGTSFVSAVNEGITSQSSTINESVATMITGCEKVITDQRETWIKAGATLMQSFMNGMTSQKNKVIVTAMSIAKAAIDAIQDSFDSNPPVIRPVLDLSTVNQQLASLNVATSAYQAAVISSSMSRSTSTNDQNGDTTPVGQSVYNYVQNNYSPKALSRTEIYRQTKTLLATKKGA